MRAKLTWASQANVEHKTTYMTKLISNQTFMIFIIRCPKSICVTLQFVSNNTIVFFCFFDNDGFCVLSEYGVVIEYPNNTSHPTLHVVSHT